MTLREFFQNNPKAALAFSGGVDSAYLLYAALSCGAQVRAYYVKSAFQPQFELDDAMQLAAELGADMRVLDVDILRDPQITANPADRCYYCKRSIYDPHSFLFRFAMHHRPFLPRFACVAFVSALVRSAAPCSVVAVLPRRVSSLVMGMSL